MARGTIRGHQPPRSLMISPGVPVSNSPFVSVVQILNQLNMSWDVQTQFLIVGAGPTGLGLASFLGQHGWYSVSIITDSVKLISNV